MAIPIIIGYRGKKYTGFLPSSWEELSPALWRKFNRVLLRTDGDEALRHIIIQAVRGPKSLKKYLSDRTLMLANEEMGFLTGQTPNHAKNMISRIGIFRGCRDKLQNMCWIQWGLAEQEFQKYSVAIKAGDTKSAKKALRNLFGVLYTARGFKWRQSWCNAWAFFARLIPTWTLIQIWWNYAGMRAWVGSCYPMTFPQPDEDDDSDSGSKGSSPNTRDFGFIGLCSALQASPYGQGRNLNSDRLHSVLTYLEQQRIEAERIRMQSKND